VESLSVGYGKGRKTFAAVNDVSFTIRESETLALVGESGSGKSTIARAISGLIAPAAGRILLGSRQLASSIRSRTREERRLIQFIFQNPDASLNPRARIATALARPIEFFFPGEAARRRQLMTEALDSVRLDANYAERFPDQLSGGERQRIAIARALVARPSLLLCDEILSALDVSVQASILALLQKLKHERRIAMLFISHDLAVVRMVADRIAVLFRGEIMEIGTREQIFRAPYHPYTYSLLQAVPTPLKRRGPLIAKRRPADTHVSGAGCVYAGRCVRRVGPICDTTKPPWQETQDGLRIRCHLPFADLDAKSFAQSQPLSA
jgi:peptide/nickel transport system ATP-binding protein